jgi:lysophospholipase L1-like esterase
MEELQMILNKNETLLFYGDSVTDAGRQRPEGEGTPSHNPWGAGYPSLVAGFLQACYPELNVRVINKGSSGDQSRDLLRRFDEDVAPLKPDVISIMIGANDAWRVYDTPAVTEQHVTPDEYEQNLRKLIGLCREITDRIIIMRPFIIEPNADDPMRVLLDKFGEICKRLADENGLAFADPQTAFLSALRYQHPYAFSWDRIHPNIGGHTILSRCVLRALGAELDR